MIPRLRLRQGAVPRSTWAGLARLASASGGGRSDVVPAGNLAAAPVSTAPGTGGQFHHRLAVIGSLTARAASSTAADPGAGPSQEPPSDDGSERPDSHGDQPSRPALSLMETLTSKQPPPRRHWRHQAGRSKEGKDRRPASRPKMATVDPSMPDRDIGQAFATRLASTRAERDRRQVATAMLRSVEKSGRVGVYEAALDALVAAHEREALASVAAIVSVRP